MADPHLRPGRPLRDRRAGAQSHVRGYRSSCGPHLASSGAAAGGSLGIARAGLPVRIGNGAPPSPGLGPATSRDAGGPSRAGVAARRIVQPPWRGPSPGTPRSLTAHRSSDSSLEARPSVGVAPAGPWIARTHTATRSRAYRFGTFDVKWQCGWRCPVRSPPSGSVGSTATRPWACSPVWAALPLGAERTVLVRSTSSGSVGGAAPCARRQAAVQHIYLSSRQAQAPLAKRGLRDESPLELLVGVLYKRNPL